MPPRVYCSENDNSVRWVIIGALVVKTCQRLYTLNNWFSGSSLAANDPQFTLRQQAKVVYSLLHKSKTLKLENPNQRRL